MGVFDAIGVQESEKVDAAHPSESAAAENTAYAVGCWLAVEHLVERLQRGQALLTAKGSPRAVTRWLRLAFRTTALIARMAIAAPSVEADFAASPVAVLFATMPWPDLPAKAEGTAEAGVDLDTFVVAPPRWTGGA